MLTRTKRRIKRWLQRFRVRPQDLDEHDPELHAAKRRLIVTTRLVDRNAVRSSRALRKLNRILELRARALEGISAAEEALTCMERVRGNDQ